MKKKALITAMLLAFAISTPVAAKEKKRKKSSGQAQSSSAVVDEAPAELPQEGKKPAKAPEINVKPGASLQTDLRFHSYPSDTPFSKDDHVANFDIRRARFDVSGDVGETYSGKLSIDLATGAKLKNAYINYKFFEPAQIQVGQFSVPFGNEALGSSMAQEFIEDSSAAKAIDPGSDRGIILHGDAFDGILAYDTGFMNGTGENVADNNDSMDFVLRTVVGSAKDSDSFFKYWLGFSFNSGSQTAVDGDSIKIATETASGTTLFRAAWPVDQQYSRTRYGFDATTLLGIGMLKFEYLFANYDFTKSATLSGGNLMASIFLTGEQRAVKNSFFTSQTVESPLDFETGGFGAIELTTRYSWFNADSAFFTTNGLFDGWEAVSATKYTDSGFALTTGLNWYPEQKVRIMFNWVNTFASKPKNIDAPAEGAKGAKRIEQAFLFRFQLAL